MKILLVSWYFPPANDVAALRTGALAQFLHDRGHAVRVLTAARPHSDKSLNVPIPQEFVTCTHYIDADRPFLRNPRVDSEKKTGGRATMPDISDRNALQKIRNRLSNAYTNLAHIPDRQVGWFPYAVAAGRRIIQQHGCTLIYASGPPFTCHLVAKSLAQRFNLPWVAEYRDAWCHYLYEKRPAWRQKIDHILELSTARTAAGIVALTDPWAKHFADRFRKPTIAIYNGIDPASALDIERASVALDPVVIACLGSLYGGVRDPSVLYRAVRQSGLSPSDVRIRYYGPSSGEVVPLARKFGVCEYVDVMEKVSHHESLTIQRQSDILLLLQSPEDPRNVPAKLFEYLGSRRPILGLGLDHGEPAKLIRERSAGIYITDTEALATQLKTWVREKRFSGAIADIAGSAQSGLNRMQQLEKLVAFLRTFHDK
ncbi:MAG TPA: glycosyltransferase [Rhizomicrobium sp.]|jgi:glycosyltransferase involved in cell wall biosynthesis